MDELTPLLSKVFYILKLGKIEIYSDYFSLNYFHHC